MKRTLIAALFIAAAFLCSSGFAAPAEPATVTAEERQIIRETIFTYEATPTAEQVTVKLENADISTVEEPCEAQTEEVNQVKSYSDIPLDAALLDKLFELCEETGLDPAIALGLIQTESNFQADAVSCTGCYGLCQLNPAYFPSGLSAADNMAYGLRYLAKNIALYGDTAAGLCAYNVGHDNGERGYANLIISRAEEWRARL